MPDYSELAEGLATEQGWRKRQRERDERIRAQLGQRELRQRELAARPGQTSEAFVAEMRKRGLPVAPSREHGHLVRPADVDWDTGIDGRRLVQGYGTGIVGDDKHAARIAADLAFRRARNEARQSELAASRERSPVTTPDLGYGPHDDQTKVVEG